MENWNLNSRSSPKVIKKCWECMGLCCLGFCCSSIGKSRKPTNRQLYKNMGFLKDVDDEEEEDVGGYIDKTMLSRRDICDSKANLSAHSSDEFQLEHTKKMCKKNSKQKFKMPSSMKKSSMAGIDDTDNRDNKFFPKSFINSMHLTAMFRRDTLESQEEELLNVANDVSKERTTVNRNPSTSGAKSKGVTSPLSVKKINQNYQTLSNTPSNLTTQGSHYNQAKFKEDSTRLNELYASGAGEEEENSNLGMVHFGLSYDFQSQNLIVKIIQAKALPAKDITGTSDPYVRLFLLPDRKSKMETRVKKKILNPIWNETFLYEGFPYHKLQNRILNLQVYDYDRFSRDDPIGEVFLPLNEVDLSQFPHYWKKLIPMDKSSKTGEILLTLTYLPGPGKLNIEIIKCKNLKASDVIGLSDPYITIWLMENGKKLLKQKTQIKFNTLSPVFQETFTFDVPTEKIRVTSLLITAKDYDKYTRNDILGSFLLASRSSPMEMKHWKDMLLNPGKPITQWHFFKKN